jgi:lipopolysaccharide assembly protein A
MTFIKKWSLRTLLLLVFIVVLLAASENSQAVALVFLDFKSPQWPVSWWMLVAFVIGLGFGLVLNTLTNTRLRLDARRAKKIVAESQRALDQSRSQLVENSQPNTSASV